MGGVYVSCFDGLKIPFGLKVFHVKLYLEPKKMAIEQYSFKRKKNKCSQKCVAMDM